MQHPKCTFTTRRQLTTGLAFTAALLALGTFSPHAAAASTWSRNPDSSLAGGRVRVASSSETLCQWIQPGVPPTPDTSPTTIAEPSTTSTTPATAPNGGDVTYDGVRVEFRLEPDSGGPAVALGSVTVTSGGAWSGTITIPGVELAPPGSYDLLAHCVVEDAQLDGVRSFDFDPLSLSIVEGPPPTTITIPTELIPPITVTNPVEVQGEQISRPAGTTSTPSTNAAAAAPTLPKTGDGTLAVALAGLGALLLGAGALWFGNRQNLRHPDVG